MPLKHNNCKIKGVMWLINFFLNLSFLLFNVFLIGSFIIIGWFFVAISFIVSAGIFAAGALGFGLFVINIHNGLGALFLSLSMFSGCIGTSILLFQVSFDFFRSYNIFYQEIIKWSKINFLER